MRDYTVEALKPDGSVDPHPSGNHTVSLTEHKTGGNDTVTPENPNNRFPVFEDHLSVSGPGRTLLMEQTFHIDGSKENATVMENKKGGDSGTVLHVNESYDRVDVTYSQ